MISLGSEITKKLLNYLFLNPDESLFVNELERKLGVDKRNLVKKLNELEKEGLLNSERKGNLRLYSINQGYPLYNEYKKIVLKTVGVEEKLRKILKQIAGVKEAYIYGSYAQDKMEAHSDIDLLVIGNHKILLLQRKLNALQGEIGREINVINMDVAEYQRRLKDKDPYVLGITKNKHIRVL